jgi:hypothetical protein
MRSVDRRPTAIYENHLCDQPEPRLGVGQRALRRGPKRIRRQATDIDFQVEVRNRSSFDLGEFRLDIKRIEKVSWSRRHSLITGNPG